MNQFEDLVAQKSKPGIVSDLFFFLRHSRKWWMAPVIALLLLFGSLMFLSGTAAAPFIYTLF